MKCTLEQRREAIALEKERLQELEANGADIEDSSQLLNDYEANIDNEVRLKNLTKKYNKNFKAVPAATINKLNTKANDLRTTQGVKVTVKSGYIDKNGRASYNVLYPNGTKEYTIGAHALVGNDMDAQHSVSDRLYAEPASLTDTEVLQDLFKGKEVNIAGYKEVVKQLIHDIKRVDGVTYVDVGHGFVPYNNLGAPVDAWAAGKDNPPAPFISALQSTLHIIKTHRAKLEGTNTTASSNNTDSKKYDDTVGEKVLNASEVNSLEAVEALMNTLEDIDLTDTTVEHKKHLMKVVRHIIGGSKKPVQEMNVYLSKEYENNHGMVEFADKKGIYLKNGMNAGRNTTDMSMMEIFVHELIHGSTHYGLNANKVKLSKEIRLLTELRSKVLEVLEPEDLVGDSAIDRDLELKIAAGRIQHMLGDNGLEEFLAMALSNEKIFAKLQTVKIKEKRVATNLGESLLNAVLNLIDSAFSLFREDPKRMRGDKLVMKLVSDIGRLNNKAKIIKEDTFFGTTNKYIDIFEKKWTKWFDELEENNQEYILDKLAAKEGIKGLGLVDKLRAVHFVVASEKGAPVLQQVLATLGLREEGFLQTIIKHLKHADKYGNTVQKLIMSASQVDMKREHTAGNISKVINAGFKTPLRKAQKKAVYAAGIMADNGTILGHYSKADVKKMYRNEKEMDKAVAEVEQRLEQSLSKGDYNYLKVQAKGLADLMMTGNSNIVQRKNARAIVEHVLGKGRTTDAAIVDTDLLVSLYATQTLDTTTKKNVAKLVETDFDGLNNLAKVQNSFRSYIATKDPDSANNLMKNYHRETYDNAPGVKIAPVKDARKLRIEGYELVENMPSLGLGFGDSTPLALYISAEKVVQPINRASFRYTGDREPGMSLWQDGMARGADIAVYDMVQEQLKTAELKAMEFEAMARAGKELPVDTNVVPVVDKDNVIVDYKTQVPLERKLKHLGLNVDPATAVGRTQAHEADLEESMEINDMVWDTLMDDMIENAHSVGDTGKNQHRYVDISRLSDVNEVKDAASILPEKIRDLMSKIKRLNILVEQANKEYDEGSQPVIARENSRDISFNEELDRYELSSKVMEEAVGKDKYHGLKKTERAKLKKIFGKNIFKVRRDMLLDIFGVRDASIANLIPDHQMTRHMKKMIRAIENAWKEIVKIFKVDVIIRTLPVIMGNIVSNAMYSVQYGLSPTEVLKRQLEGVHELKRYLVDQDEHAQTLAKLAANPGDKKLLRKKAELESSMQFNPVKELIDQGLYQHIIDDVNTDEFRSNSKIANYISDKTEGAPELIKSAGNWLFINEKTSLFQLVTKATAYSDFVARYAQYTLGVDKEQKSYQRIHGKSMSEAQVENLKKQMSIVVRDSYVNYSKPDSKVLQYMNDMGFVAFSKYAIRIQQAIQHLIKAKPLRFVIAMLGQEIVEMGTGWNPDDIAEISVWSRPVEKWVYTPGMDKIIGDIIEPQMITHIKSALS